MNKSDTDVDAYICCAMISSWVAIPSTALLVLCLHYFLGLSGIFLYIIIGVLSVGLLLIAILTTIGYKQNNIDLTIIASFIAIPIAIIETIFWIGFFFIFSIINKFAEYIELGFWEYSALFVTFCLAFPPTVCIAMFYKVISQKH